MQLHGLLRRIGTVTVLAALVLVSGSIAAEPQRRSTIAFPFKAGDRVAWMGSSSTAIGQYCQALEFLLQTRHPDLKLVFHRYSNPSKGTFATALASMPRWLAEAKPTLIFFQYGGNDSALGEDGLTDLKVNMEKCLAKAKDAGARVLFVTPQAVDPRRFPKEKAEPFNLYAEKVIAFSNDNSWTVIDTHHPLEALLAAGQRDDPKFTITTDKSHMTLAAYVAWAYYEYELLNPPAAESTVELTAQGEVTAAAGCRVSDVQAGQGTLTFTRADQVLPILPPVALPPRKHVPLEALSPYLLKVTGLAEGTYQIRCDDSELGAVDAAALAKGVNLNSLLLDSGAKAPWAALAKELWDKSRRPLGKPSERLEQIGQTRFRFEVKKQ